MAVLLCIALTDAEQASDGYSSLNKLCVRLPFGPWTQMHIS